MLKIALVLGALAVVFALAWRALRRSNEPPSYQGDDAYMRNIRATTGNFGTHPHPPAELDPMKAPIFPPTQRNN